MTLATGPIKICPSGFANVTVIAANGILPVQNAKVTILSTYSIMGIVLDSKRHDPTTGINGLAEVCEENRLTKSYAVEVWIQKSNVDFNSGVGQPHRLGYYSGLARAAMPAVVLFAFVKPSVCDVWDTVANISIPILMRPDFSFPINISGAKWECPSLGTSEPISNVKAILSIPGAYPYAASYAFSISLIDGVGDVNLADVANITNIVKGLLQSNKTSVELELSIPNKDFGDTTFTRSVSLPSVDIIPDVCTVWDTVATPNVPSTMATSFPISVSGAKYICKDFDDAELIGKDGVVYGKIEIGEYTFDFPIQNGYGRVNLEDLIDLTNFGGLFK